MGQPPDQVNPKTFREGFPTRRRLLSFAPLLASGRVLGKNRVPSPARNIPGSLDKVEGLITPVEQFFVRDHFEEPDLSLADWRLSVEGHVDRPFEIGFSELLLAPTIRRQATLECAGNGSPGFAVSTGLWTGTPLSFLLRAAGLRSDASTVMLQGFDEGLLFDNAQRGPYTRLVPLADCLAPEAMVAYEVNRQFLPRRNGFPARALLPGWYAMNSVKWLRRILVLRRGERPAAFVESGMDQLYVRVLQGQTIAQQLGRLQLKSAIAFPAEGSRLPAGVRQIRGFAWGSDAPVRGVLVSTDGGKSWHNARMESPADRFNWGRWSFDWNATPGRYALLSRAEGESGVLQPLSRDPHRVDGYELNQCARLNCSVL